MNPHPFDYLSVCLSVFYLVSLSVCQSVYIFVILLLYKESRGLAWKKKGFHSIPAAQKAGDVLITVYTAAGRNLGVTYFTYVDEMHEAFKLLIKNRDRHTEFFIMWYLEHGITGINSNVALTLGLFGLSDQGMWI